MQLTQEQSLAKDKLLDFLFDNQRQEIILQGHAGTGKTTLIKSIVESYNKAIILASTLGVTKRPFVFCATTNKACEALQQNGIKANTIHSVFKLNTNDVPYNPHSIYSIPDKGIYIIDECSYLNYTQFDYIRNKLPNAKIIYVGDKNQLTPVGLNHSPVYYTDIEMIELTNPIRQQNAQEIAHYCHKLRYAITHNTQVPSIPLGKQIIHLNKQEFEQTIKEQFDAYDGTQKILAVKNTTVQKYNSLLAKEIQEHDYLVNNSYHQAVQLPNNHLVKVVHVFGKMVVLGTRVTHCRIETFEYGQVNVYIPKSATAIKRAYNHIQSENDERLFKKLIDLRPPYAQTIHKAQGSTYQNVFICLDDLKSIKTKEEINRLLYVAFSRATDKVYLTGELL